MGSDLLKPVLSKHQKAFALEKKEIFIQMGIKLFYPATVLIEVLLGIQEKFLRGFQAVNVTSQTGSHSLTLYRFSPEVKFVQQAYLRFE